MPHLLRLVLFGCLPAFVGAADWQLVSVKRIWDQPRHAAFGDLIRWNERWYCVFREGAGHAPQKGKPDDGRLRILSSSSGDQWESEALLAETGVDLRDPHLSLTPDHRLMVIAGGSYYPNGEYTGRQSRVFFSRDGRTWTSPAKVMAEGHWLWRATWHHGTAFGVSKFSTTGRQITAESRRVQLVRSGDGVKWETVTDLQVPGGDESTVRFLDDDTLVALVRRTWVDSNGAWVGTSRPPYREWTWHPCGLFIGGPNFIVLPSGRWVAGGRLFDDGDRNKPYTAVGELTSSGFTEKLRLPADGDASYPGFVWHEGLLWTLYYSSHEGKTSIYLAKIKGPE